MQAPRQALSVSDGIMQAPRQALSVSDGIMRAFIQALSVSDGISRSRPLSIQYFFHPGGRVRSEKSFSTGMSSCDQPYL